MKYDVITTLLLLSSLLAFVMFFVSMDIIYTVLGWLLLLLSRGIERYERRLMQKRLNEDKY